MRKLLASLGLGLGLSDRRRGGWRRRRPPRRPLPRHPRPRPTASRAARRQLPRPLPRQPQPPAPAAAGAPAAPAPVPNKGDTAWMTVATLLVILMTIPGLALFYGGLVRSKNMLSVLMQVFVVTAMIYVLWALYGYSLAFTAGNPFIGSFDKLFLKGVTADSRGRAPSARAS